MSTVAYLGDEIGAAGYRLAGVAAVVPEPGAEWEAFTLACGEASLVLVCAAVAERLPQARLRSAQAALSPLILIVPDVAGAHRLPDVAEQLRAELGMQA